MKMLSHQQRVVDEKVELDKKANALSEFIGNNPVFDTLDTKEQERLRVQNDIMWQYSEILGARIAALTTTQPRLTVRLQSFPETNGKRNWTALLVRVDEWDGLRSNCGGITIARGEYWNRVAHEAERTKLLIGERDTEPNILDYSDDITTPEQWAG